MSDVETAILDAAERRIRAGGFNGFSFRDLAVDVGVKSSSVHYHFPTKENLGGAVVKRYAERAAALFDEKVEAGTPPVQAWVELFRATLHAEEHMCPCIALSASLRELPSEVRKQVERFFAMVRDKLTSNGVTSEEADKVVASISGGMLIANALRDHGAYDRATSHLLSKTGKRRPAAVKPAKKHRKN